MQHFNFHTHTKRCGHASDMEDEEYVVEFINKGFKHIAFTDHCPQKYVVDKRKNMRMDYSQKDEYLNSIKYLKEKYKDKIQIESGFEIEYLPDQIDNLKILRKESDRLVLGQHFVYGKDNNLKIVNYDSFDINDLFTYVEYIKKACEKHLVDVIVHPDIFMFSRQCFSYDEQKITRLICEISLKYDVPLEINLTQIVNYLTNRINKIVYPSKEFWRIVSEYNVKVLYGIDAHFKNQIELFEKSLIFVNDYIGKEYISKINFIDDNDEFVNRNVKKIM